MKKVKIWLIILAIIIAIGALGYIGFTQANKPGKYDDFAKCLKNNGAVFYGAFWCPHCQDQKDLFGNSKKYLPYVECSTPDSNGQLEVCKNAKVEAYPNWQFKDGSKVDGEVSLQKLAEKTSCILP